VAQKRATETIKTRRYRYTKKNPKSQKAIFELDRGNVKQIIQLSFPNATEIKSVEIPKEKNPNLKIIKFGNLKIAIYVNTPTFQMNEKKKQELNEMLKELGIQKKIDDLAFKRNYSFEKGYIYDLDGNYSGTFRLNDLKMLYSDLGAFFKALKIEIT
jgi:hypothetical protein